MPPLTSQPSLMAQKLRAKMAKTLVPTFMAGGEQRMDLFHTWLEKGHDFMEVEVEVQRRNSQKEKAELKDKCMSKRELEQDPRYTPEDVKELIERKTKLGEYVADPNFPDRVDLRRYIVNAEISKKSQHIREDSQQVGSKMHVTAEEGLMLTEAGGDFAAGNTPTIRSLMGSGASDVGGTPKPPPPTKEPKRKAKAKAKTHPNPPNDGGIPGEDGADPQPDKPPTPLEKAILLKKSVFLVLYFMIGFTIYFATLGVRSCVVAKFISSELIHQTHDFLQPNVLPFPASTIPLSFSG